MSIQNLESSNNQQQQQKNSISSIQKKIKKQIQNLSNSRQHHKKQVYSNKFSKSNQSKISQVSQDALYLNTLKTDLNPIEIVNIISQYMLQQNESEIVQLSDYSYQINQTIQYVECGFDDEFNMIEVLCKKQISYVIFLQQLIEDQSRFAVNFKNLISDNYLEFSKIENQLIKVITSF